MPTRRVPLKKAFPVEVTAAAKRAGMFPILGVTVLRDSRGFYIVKIQTCAFLLLDVEPFDSFILDPSKQGALSKLGEKQVYILGSAFQGPVREPTSKASLIEALQMGPAPTCGITSHGFTYKQGGI